MWENPTLEKVNIACSAPAPVPLNIGRQKQKIKSTAFQVHDHWAHTSLQCWHPFLCSPFIQWLFHTFSPALTWHWWPGFYYTEHRSTKMSPLSPSTSPHLLPPSHALLSPSRDNGCTPHCSKVPPLNTVDPSPSSQTKTRFHPFFPPSLTSRFLLMTSFPWRVCTFL